MSSAEVGREGSDPRPLARFARKKLGEETTRYLRELLLSGHYVSGDRMAVHHLAEMLGVSTMPVREALVTLANEGLLEVVPRRGFRVAAMSRRDVGDAFRVHAYTAGLLAEEAAAIISPERIAELRSVQESVVALFRDGSGATDLPLRIEEKNFLFHRIINHVSDAKRLRWFLRAATRYVPRRFYETVPGWMELTRDRHDAIVDALEARDKAAARRKMEQHVLEAGRMVVEHLTARGLD